MEIETNVGTVYKCGKYSADDNNCVFDIPHGHKVIAFAGVMEVMINECRLLNLSTVSKPLLDDCEHSEQSVSYKEIVKDHYFKFNVMKTDVMEDIKRIKAVKLYPGKSLGEGK